MWLTSILFFAILRLLVQAGAQTCLDTSPYRSCSFNPECGCLPLTNSESHGICALLYARCSELNSCVNNQCFQPNHLCVKHSRCQGAPLCYPMKMTGRDLCPPLPLTTTTAHPSTPAVLDDGICASATWNENGLTVAGGNGQGPALNQLDEPLGLFVDDDGVIYIADTLNFRVIKWMPGASSGQVVAGGNGEGNQMNQLHYVSKMVFDKHGTMFICDHNNKRVQRWLKNADRGETIIESISCWGLALDKEEALYVSDWENLSVRKWPGGQVVAGGNGEGPALNQLSYPCDVFVDQNQSVFVADDGNRRVIKWPVGAKEGIVVAGPNQLESPQSVVVDQMGTVYTVDYANHVMRWLQGSTSGSVIIGGQGAGNGAAELSNPTDLAFDCQGNLYVVDRGNQRVQMFSIDKSSCEKDTL